MRQKNITGSTLQVMIDPPIDVPAGGEVDHDTLLAGFAPVGRKGKTEAAEQTTAGDNTAKSDDTTQGAKK